MKQLNDDDDAIMKIWWWLRGNIKDGLLLSICLAVLEEDLETLETISKINFARRYGVGEVSAIACNQALRALGLVSALQVGFRSMSVGSVESSAMGLMCESPKTRLNLKGKGEGFDFTHGILHGAPVQPEAVLSTIRQALIAAVEAKLSRC